MSAAGGISPWLRKRQHLDRAIGVIGSVMAAPIIGGLALAVRAQDGGPGLITVERVGRHGQVFRMWKVRSMRQATAVGSAAGPALTRSADQRVTPLGRRMRQLHLDELPQVFNVARGEMLLLGPRPEAPQWVDPDDRRWDHVLEIPPGIAGPTQLIVDKWELSVIDEAPDGSAYVEIVVPVKQAIDSWYVDQASPRVDFLVLRSLLSSTLLRRTPRALRKAVRRDVLEAESPIRWDDAQPG